MIFNIITIFPNIFDSYFQESIIKRAQESNKIKINIFNLRDFTEDKHKQVDDTPYGGGAGMVMKIEPLYRAIMSLRGSRSHRLTKQSRKNSKIILLSPKGKTWNQSTANKYSKLDEITLICGRYEGVDERITNFIDEEISIGDYVLTGGEIPVMAIVDSITRLIPGVLGNPKSIEEESFSQKIENSKLKIQNCLEYPQYTKPAILKTNRKKYEVPKVLLSGNHAEIEKWRKENQKKK